MPAKELPNSSAIERVGYNEETQRLSIWFKGWRRYIYAGVPRSVYDELCECSSAGKFVRERVVGPVHREAPWKRFGPNARRD